LLVSALTREAATESVLVWLSRQDHLGLMISDWVVTEFSSALSIKMRMNQLSANDRAKVFRVFTELRNQSLQVVPVTRDHFMTAARFAEQYGLGLRAGDALHAAVAGGHGATIQTLDKRLAAVAVALGVSAELV
jgi:uncharacterized protein